MIPRRFPITDDHIHIDPVNGRGIEAAKDFLRAGGTHLFLVSKPSWSFDVYPESGEDYRAVYDGTLEVARRVRELGLTVFPVLGVHPAEITVFSDRRAPAESARVMAEGLDLAAEYVREGRAVALKSGRPHYDAGEEILALSNRVLARALELGAREGCAVQLHAESGPCDDVVDMARVAGIEPSRVVKHFADPETLLVPSLIARHGTIPEIAASRRPFMLESDYIDERDRPGSVIGPKSVPRFSHRLLASGAIDEEALARCHVETPSNVYGVEISL
ncbi:MAG: hydrolase TatD [Methanospirillum sp.]|nr:hydrolase TatD [Methanospirillum sp.]